MADHSSLIVDLFAGIGWGIGLRMLGLDEVGFDVDADVCVNRAQLGMATVRADVSSWPLEPLRGRVAGLLAGPPCPDFSAAGRRAGRAGESGWLVDEPLRWVLELRPRWAAWEQVPPVLEIWHEHAEVLRSAGYSVWCGNLDAARYGVPQKRLRAILMASLDGPMSPPEPTHDYDPTPTLFASALRPVVSMADAVDWDGLLHTNRDQRPDGTRQTVPCNRPAPTVTAKSCGQWKIDGRPVTATELGVLQGFPPGLELPSRMVGNAVPPPLAAAIVAELAGWPF